MSKDSQPRKSKETARRSEDMRGSASDTEPGRRSKKSPVELEHGEGGGQIIDRHSDPVRASPERRPSVRRSSARFAASETAEGSTIPQASGQRRSRRSSVVKPDGSRSPSV